jgi:hypothetical protein
MTSIKPRVRAVTHKVLLAVVVACCSLTVPVMAAPDFTAIKQSALLADAAYSDKAAIQATLSELKLPLLKIAELPGSEVSYFLTQTSQNNTQMIAVRGTANLQNVMVDLDVNLKLDEKLGIQVHQGFADAATAVYNDLKAHINKDQPIHTTGHSLGGAVAVILGMYLQQDDYNLQSVITFGQPKVTNVGGTQVFSNLPLTRVVTTEDIVPLVPPLSPLQLKNLDIYWHNGDEIILKQGSEYSITNGLKSMMRATKIVTVMPSESNLNAHKMTTYLSLIESKLIDAKEVPYKTGLNVFGLSFD